MDRKRICAFYSANIPPHFVEQVFGPIPTYVYVGPKDKLPVGHK
jgi:hypothetical protein